MQSPIKNLLIGTIVVFISLSVGYFGSNLFDKPYVPIENDHRFVRLKNTNAFKLREEYK